MKLIHVLTAAALASVLPSASADERAKQPKPFSIAFSSEVAPVSYGEFRYPSYAGVRNLSGQCEVSFAIGVSGKPDAIRIASCTSDSFRAAAKSTVQAMSFAPRAAALDRVQMEIRWTVNPPAALRTASLN